LQPAATAVAPDAAKASAAGVQPAPPVWAEAAGPSPTSKAVGTMMIMDSASIRTRMALTSL
jgi:hypothetical protein